MIDFCALNNVLPQIEIIQPNQIDDYFTKILNGEVYFRAVIDMRSVEWFFMTDENVDWYLNYRLKMQ